MEYISVGNEKLHYLRYGTGEQLLLAFHGYGNDATLFDPFIPHLHNAYTILSFDLPHHGKSEWTEDTVFRKRDLVIMVAALKEKFKVDKVSLLGYSMGGRVCLTITQYMPESIDKVALVATDGLRIDHFYYFLTRTYFGKKLFKKELLKPDRFFKVIDWLKRKKWLDAHKYKFVMNYMKPPDSRKFLMQVWPGMSQLMTSPPKLKRAIKQHHIPVSIFMGAYDRVMPPILAEKFKEGLDSVQLFILDKGHRVFDAGNAHLIAEHLL
jgi:pimeloyl-ACP methyl ester carboxylesterase